MRRLLFLLLGAALLPTVALLFLFFLLKPSARPSLEIYHGVFLTVEELEDGIDGAGAMMLIEVHWDTPGVRIENRAFDYQVNSNDDAGHHYDLKIADVALRQSGAAVLMNTNLYHPASRLRSLPGTPVRSVETVVVDGVVSHVHEHSYLLYWDAKMDSHMVLSKPPSPESLNDAILGLGMQGVQVQSAQARYHAMGDLDKVEPRAFIGIDPNKRILYLMAFENVSGRFMIDRAVQAGVVYGGQLDSGSSTHLLIGENAKGVKAHTGIRNLRPLGPYITVYADPL